MSSVLVILPDAVDDDVGGGKRVRGRAGAPAENDVDRARETAGPRRADDQISSRVAWADAALIEPDPGEMTGGCAGPDLIRAAGRQVDFLCGCPSTRQRHYDDHHPLTELFCHSRSLPHVWKST